MTITLINEKQRKAYEGFHFIVEYAYYGTGTEIGRVSEAYKEKIVHKMIDADPQTYTDLEELKSALLELHCLDDVDPRSIVVTPVVPFDLAMKQFNRIMELYNESLTNEEGGIDNQYLISVAKQMLENITHQEMRRRKVKHYEPIPYHKIKKEDKQRLDQILFEENDGQDVLYQLLREV